MLREIRREGEEEQEVHGQHCQGAASQAQTKEPNQRKWEAEKGKQQDSCWVSLAGTSFLLFSVSVLNLEKNVTLKKKKDKKICTFLCIYALFRRSACILPYPSQYLSPENGEA